MTEKLEERLKLTRNLSILLIIIGVVLLIFEDFSSLMGSIDSLVFPVIGIIWLFSSLKNLKKISGSYLEFGDDQISFKSRECEAANLQIKDIVELKIKLKTIEFRDINDISYSIYLDDYSEFKDKKAIKEKFENIKSKIKTPSKNLKSFA